MTTPFSIGQNVYTHYLDQHKGGRKLVTIVDVKVGISQTGLLYQIEPDLHDRNNEYDDGWFDHMWFWTDPTILKKWDVAVLKNWMREQKDRAVWRFVEKHKDDFLIRMDNDDTWVKFQYPMDEEEEYFAYHFAHYLGMSEGTFLLLGSLGIRAESV